MKLDAVVPWGRSLEEYRLMFALSASDLEKNILGCGDGPASFNAEVTAMGGSVISADPVYAFTSEQIRSRIDDVYPEIMRQTQLHADNYNWSTIGNAEALGSIRMAAMNTFLADYAAGIDQGRYVCAQLPELPFSDQRFELALCSHFLFLYSEQIDLDQHVRGMKELCRVAKEVRVYPLLSLDGSISPHIKAVAEALADVGVNVSTTTVDYAFQKGAIEMLVAKHHS